MNFQRALVLLLLGVGPLTAAEDFTYCTVCHGANAQGNPAILAPALVGIETWYLADALAAYRAGQRGPAGNHDLPGVEMKAAAREIAVSQEASILQFLARLPPQPRSPSVAGDARVGKRLYTTHCASCHGQNARGNATLHAPDLTRINDWYLAAAFRKYQSGIRGADTAATWANQMHLLVRALPADFPINDIARHVDTLRVAVPRR